jgi:hypothetical protein
MTENLWVSILSPFFLLVLGKSWEWKPFSDYCICSDHVIFPIYGQKSHIKGTSLFEIRWVKLNGAITFLTCMGKKDWKTYSNALFEVLCVEFLLVCSRVHNCFVYWIWMDSFRRKVIKEMLYYVNITWLLKMIGEKELCIKTIQCL